MLWLAAERRISKVTQTDRQTDKQTYFISPCWTATFAVKNTGGVVKDLFQWKIYIDYEDIILNVYVQ